MPPYNKAATLNAAKALTGLGLALWAGLANAAELTVTIAAVNSAQGNVLISVYNTPDQWLKREANSTIAAQSLPANTRTTQNTLSTTFNLPAGQYAIAVMHDIDGNGKLKTNWIGIPKEPVGSSSPGGSTMGPPKYKNALFALTSNGHQHTITLK